MKKFKNSLADQAHEEVLKHKYIPIFLSSLLNTGKQRKSPLLGNIRTG